LDHYAFRILDQKSFLPLFTAREDQPELGMLAVVDMDLAAGYRPRAVAAAFRKGTHRADIRSAAEIGQSERRNDRSVDQPRQIPALLRLRPEFSYCVCDHEGDIDDPRNIVVDARELLHEDAVFDNPVALAPILGWHHVSAVAG